MIARPRLTSDSHFASRLFGHSTDVFELVGAGRWAVQPCAADGRGAGVLSRLAAVAVVARSLYLMAPRPGSMAPRPRSWVTGNLCDAALATTASSCRG